MSITEKDKLKKIVFTWENTIETKHCQKKFVEKTLEKRSFTINLGGIDILNKLISPFFNGVGEALVSPTLFNPSVWVYNTCKTR